MAGMKGNLVVPLTDAAGAPAGTARLQAAQYVPRLSFERGSAALDIEDPHPHPHPNPNPNPNWPAW